MKKHIEKIFTGIICVALATGPWCANAATNPCDNIETYPYINPALALCTTHAYNIGLDTNPTNSTQRQAMNQAVALKTTLMTQQMYSQYEYLNATIRRIKTQLEKAITTNRMQAAGAITSGGASGGGAAVGAGAGGTTNQALSNAYNCKTETGGFSGVMSCLERNVNVMTSALSTNYVQVRKQLENDIKLFNSYQTYLGKKPEDGIKIDGSAKDGSACKNLAQANKNNVEKCLDDFRIQLGSATYQFERQNKTSTKP